MALPDNVDPASIRLRPFIRADDPEVSSWFPDAGALRFFAGRRLSWPLNDEQWDDIRSDPAITAWTAVIGDDPTPVGHGEMVKESVQLVRFARLAVAPPLRGRQLGREVMRYLIQKARDSGYSRAHLFVHPDNVSAIRGYRSLGFEPADPPGTPGNLRMELVIA